MQIEYDAILFDLFGTLVSEAGIALPGAAASLAAVREAPWAIVTSCSRRMARELIAQAGLPEPSVLICGDELAANKPAPDGYLCAAQLLGVEPARALVVEDSAQGIAAARRAGMDVIAVLRGRPPAFARAATFVIEDLTSLRVRAGDGALCLEL